MASWKDKLASRARRKAKFSRRAMMKVGLASAGGALAARQGIGEVAADNGGNLSLGDVDGLPPSPISTPWSWPMPQLQLRQATAKLVRPANAPNPLMYLKEPVGALNPPPKGYTWTHGALPGQNGLGQTAHKLFSVNADGTFGPGEFGNYPPGPNVPSAFTLN